MVQTKQDGRRISLLGHHEITSYQPICAPLPTKTEERPEKGLEIDNYHVTVRLLQAVKIPARHSRLVRVKADQSDRGNMMLFGEQKGKNVNICVVTCASELDESDSMVLTVENHSLQLVVLEKGLLEIGSLEPVQLVPVDSDALGISNPEKLKASDNEEDSLVRKEKFICSSTVNGL